VAKLTWIKLDDGFWDNPDNWQDGLLPGPLTAGDDVLIDVSGDITTIHRTGESSINRLDSEEAFTNSGGTLTANVIDVNNTFTMAGGKVANAEIDLEGGSLVFKSALNYLDGAKILGDLTLDQPSSLLYIQNGTEFTGNANLSGYNARLFVKENCTLDATTINLNGNFSSLGTINHTLTLGPTSQINLNGQGSRLTSESGGVGTAQLINQGIITVSGTTGSRRIQGDEFQNQGTIAVQDGATLDVVSGFENTVGSIVLGNESTLNFNNGTSITSADLGNIDETAGGRIYLNGAAELTLIEDVNLTVLDEDAPSWQTFTVVDGKPVTFYLSPTVHIEEGSLSGGGQRLIADIFNSDEVNPGHGVGTLNLLGNYTQASEGTLNLEFAGIEPGAYDQFNVTGNASFDGTLSIQLVDGFDATITGGDFFNAITYSTLNNQDFTFDFPELNPSLVWVPDIDPSQLSITVVDQDFLDGTVEDIGVLGSEPILLNGAVRDGDAVALYRFELSEETGIKLDLTNLNANANLRLLDNDYRLILESNESGIDNEELSHYQLPAGAYYIRAYQSEIGNNTDFTLQLQQVEDSDSLETAIDLGILPGIATTGNAVGASDPEDFYRFELAQDSAVDFTLSNFSTPIADLQIFDSSGSGFDHLGMSNSRNLHSGVYFLKVYKPLGHTDYHLTLDAAEIVDKAGNSLGDARDLSILSAPQTVNDWVGKIDEHDYYRFELLKDSDFTLSLGELTANADVALLNRQGNIIASSNTLGSSDESMELALDAGTYFVHVSNAANSENTNYALALNATSLPTPFEVRNITPDKGSNAGQVTVTLEGAQFTPDAQVNLISPTGGIQSASQMRWQDNSTLLATFDLTTLAIGNYDVQVIDQGGTATDESGFTVNSGPVGELAVSLTVPDAVRAWWTGEATVNYRNIGETDIPAPLWMLQATGGLLRQAGEERFTEDSIQFLGTGSDGDPSTLSPGESGSFSVQFQPLAGAPEVHFEVNNAPDQVSILEGSPSYNNGYFGAVISTLDWAGLKNEHQPEWIPADTWDAIWTNFTNAVGNDFDRQSLDPDSNDYLLWDEYHSETSDTVGTVSQYRTTLTENAAYLQQLGDPTNDVSQLLAFELYQASNYGSLMQRYHLGPFGRGWSFPWNITATLDSEGNIVINRSGRYRYFERQHDGSYQGQPGDYAALSQEGDIYQLQEKGGTLAVFSPNGNLDYMEDSNGNRVQVEHTDALVTGLTYTNGDHFSFEYNSQGRISQITDPVGRISTYSYDGSSEHLLSVTTPQGTTTYTYITNPGVAQHAVSSITYADGTQQLFDYDEQGRLQQESFSNGLEPLSYDYGSTGEVIATNGELATAQWHLNDRGQVGRIVDPLERITQLRYDEGGNLIRLIAPDNSIYAFNYDDRGNLTSQIDPLSQRIEFTYEPTFDQLESVTDAKGNQVEYGYDRHGNLINITYTDNSSENFSYDDRGNLTTAVNRRDHITTYIYNPRDQLLSQSFADGSAFRYTYDTRGNLTEATDARGSTVLEYDAADRLVKITDPSGRFLTFAYDAGGRRTQMVDQDGFTVNYSYDAAGRLAGLTNAQGNAIVTYTYDIVGRLARDDNGNGTYTTYDYDLAGQLLRLVNYAPDGTVNSRFDYTYDDLGQVTTMTTLDGIWTYNYDAIGQLTQAILISSNPQIPGQDLSYEYDAAGNRIRTVENDIITNYTTAGTTTYDYDADGNLIAKHEGSQTWLYGYNTRNQLVSVLEPDGTQTTYEYDALGNRVASIRNSQRTEYLIDPFGLGDVVGKYDGSGALMNRYTHGLGLENLTDDNGVTAYYDFSAIGSTAGLTGATGDYLNRYHYLPFGSQLSETESLPNAFEFVGRWGVMEEDNGLHFMRARYYSPSEGTFLSIDPLGVPPLGLYTYAKNSPMAFIDPSGLKGFARAIQERHRRIYNVSSGHEKDWKDLENFKPEFRKEAFDFARDLLENIRLTKPNPFQLIRDWGPIYLDLVDDLPDDGPGGSDPGGSDPGGSDPGDDGPDDDGPDDPNHPDPDPDPTDPRPGEPGDGDDTPVPESQDPNDVVGPAGFGAVGWLTPDATLPYMVRFENAVDADVPAVFVTITHQLDTDLDWTTFELGDFGFGDTYIDIPEGFQHYSTRVDTRDVIGDFVNFAAGIDLDTGVVTWSFRTIEPTTGELPTEVDAGFLPPNNENHDGEGFVNYRIQPKPALSSGTELTAEASIVFDTNEAIDTPVHLNTVDVDLPSSVVNPLPTTTPNPEIAVSWDGSDAHSGIASYDVYVSVDGDPFVLWLEQTTDTTANFLGQAGRTYSFYSVARDNVGHHEPTPVLADSTITVTTDGSPIAVDDSFNTDEDTPLNGTVLSNDSDPNGDELTASLLSDVSHGLLTFNDNGTFNYTPDNDFNGSDGFSYTASDGELSDMAIVTIEVLPVNDAPTGTIAISGIPEEGNLLTVDTSALNDIDGLPEQVTFAYQWQQWINGDWVNIFSANGSTFNPNASLVGYEIRAQVTYTDLGGTSEAVSSSAVEVSPFDDFVFISDSVFIDLIDFPGIATMEFKINREAYFDNIVGFYKVTDANGGID
jgi:RHS repeat-associated protein